MKESAAFIADAKQGSRQPVLKRPELPKGFHGKVFKDRVREACCGVCDQLVDILLIGWW